MFEESLIASSKQKKSPRRLLIIPIAIALHILVLTGVLVAQYWNVDPVDEPPIQVTFFQAAAPPPPPPPPPPPAPPKAPEPQTPKPTQVVVPKEPVQPVEVPKELPKPEPVQAAPSDAGVEGGVEGGVPGGVPGGVLGGVVGGTQGGTGDEILRVGGDVSPPEVLNRVQPVYTETARRARVQGIVIVEAIISRTGEVENVRVLKGLPMGLDQAAVDAVKRWTFKPATQGGRPVNVYFILTVNFKVQ